MADWHTTTLTKHQRQVDREANIDFKLDELRNEATLTAEEIYTATGGISDSQYMQICESLAEVANGNNNVAALRYMLRLVCADVINKKARKALEEMQNGLD